MIKILDIKVEITQPVNILPDGTMDPSKDYWVFGGVGYLVKTKDYTYNIQLDGNIWYSPDWQIHSASLNDVLEKVIAIEKDYEEYFNKNSGA